MQQRLFEITHILMAKGNITASELAERFGVSRRTIYRDIDTLSVAGIPVYAERGKGGGIRLLSSYVMDKALFSKEEQEELLGNLQGLSLLGAPDTEAALTKLAALFGPQDNWLEIDFAPWGDGDETRELFRMFRQSILQHKLVSFTYIGNTGKPMLRLVEPYTLLFRGQGWYLRGYAKERADFRFFKLTRIQQAKQLEETFLPREIPPASASLNAMPTDMLPVTLEFSAKAAFRVYDEFPAAQIERRSNGSFVVNCQFPPGDWLVGYLLSFGEDAAVLKPDTLRQTIINTLAAMREKYC